MRTWPRAVVALNGAHEIGAEVCILNGHCQRMALEFNEDRLLREQIQNSAMAEVRWIRTGFGLRQVENDARQIIRFLPGEFGRDDPKAVLLHRSQDLLHYGRTFVNGQLR